MIAAVKFIGIIGGKEKTFAAGDPISADEAKELGLSAKTNLAKGSKGGAKTSKSGITNG